MYPKRDKNGFFNCLNFFNITKCSLSLLTPILNNLCKKDLYICLFLAQTSPVTWSSSLCQTQSAAAGEKRDHCTMGAFGWPHRSRLSQPLSNSFCWLTRGITWPDQNWLNIVRRVYTSFLHMLVIIGVRREDWIFWRLDRLFITPKV